MANSRTNPSKRRCFFHDNGLSIALLASFLLLLAGQSWVGWLECNDERREHRLPALGWTAYLASSHFWEATTENWESEFFQMSVYVMLTAFLYQRGSAESKKLNGDNPQDEDPRRHRRDPGAPWPVRRGGWVLRLYEYSLSLAFVLLFLISIAMHAWSGSRLYDEEQTALGEAPAGFFGYFATSRFWFESLQNWQSEFLAVASIVLLSVYLRHRGSPESKPVAAPHCATGE